MPRIRGVMGFFGGSSFPIHPTKILMGNFAGSTAEIRCVEGAAFDGVVLLVAGVLSVSYFITGGLFQELLQGSLHCVCEFYRLQFTPLCMQV